MKSCITKILSLLLTLVILCSLIPPIPTYAISGSGKLDNFYNSGPILDKISEYFNSNDYLKTTTCVFFFEGGSNSENEYIFGGIRDQAIAIVTKNGEITYVEDQCSTIPDVPDQAYPHLGSTPSSANVLDGIYRFVGEMHNGREAFQIRAYENVQNMLPCIRFYRDKEYYWLYDAKSDNYATEIDIHGRSSTESKSETDPKPNSSGCVVVGCDYNEYDAFRDHITGGDWSEGQEYGYVVIDRKMAKNKLKVSDLYSKYPGAVEDMLGLSGDGDPFFDVTVDPIGNVAQNSPHDITGTISSNCKITDVTGTIFSGSTEVQSCTINPNIRYVKLIYSEINKKLKFGELSPGTYTLRIAATNTNGVTQIATVGFTVGNSGGSEPTAPASEINVHLDPIGTIPKGSDIDITGKIVSNYNILSVTAVIYFDSEPFLTEPVVLNPTKSIDLKDSGINEGIDFGSLATGSYVLELTAKDANGGIGKDKVEFNVKSRISIILEKVFSIIKGNSHEISGEITSKSKITTIIAKIFSGDREIAKKEIRTKETRVVLQNSMINACIKSDALFSDLPVGSYTLEITAINEDGETESARVDFTVVDPEPSTEAADTLSIGVDPIGTVNKGSVHNITGQIISDYSITEVVGRILSGSKVMQSYTIYPGTTMVNLKSSAINTNLRFGSLPSGSYALQITATDASGTSKTADIPFTIKAAASTLSVSVDDFDTVLLGDIHNISGKIISNYKITRVVGEILSGSTVKQSHTINPNTTSVDLQSSAINTYLKFADLVAGSYKLRITATDASGASKNVDVSFAVQSDSTLGITVGTIGTIVQGEMHNITGKVTSNYVITKVIGEILSGSTVKQSHTIYPNTKSVDLQSSDLNAYLTFGSLTAGNYMLRITATDESGECKVANVSFAIETIPSTLSVSVDAIGTITQGKTHNITGKVTSNYVITKVIGEILSGSTVKQSHTINPNTTSVDLQSSAINTYLKFAKLTAGSYKLRITATDASGMSKSTEQAFTVSANSTLTVTVGTIGTITQGSAHDITGTVTSNYKITEVVGEILSGSTVKQSHTINPNTTSVDLQSSAINTNLRFGILTAGSYTLRIMATDANGGSDTTNVSFTVKNPADISITINSIGTIIKGSSHNITGSVTSGYKITNVTGKILSGTELVQSYVIRPYTTSVDLKSSAINMNLKFGTLAVGTYVLQITATDESGKTVTKKVSFTVVNYKGQFGMALPIFPIGNRPSIPDIGVIRADWESLRLGGTKS